MVKEHTHQITNSCFAGWREKLHVLLFFFLLSGKPNSLLLSPGCIELQILQPFFDYRRLDGGQLFLPPAWPDPTVKVALIPITGRPSASVLAVVDQLLQPEVFDYILHRDSTECVYLIRVDGQSPTPHRSLGGSFRLVLVKGAY